jgi:hypothetical protein
MNAPGSGAGADNAAEVEGGRGPPGQARLRQLADEQASLRRVATLVAGGARPAEVFTAVADELGRLIGAEATFVSRVNDTPGEPEGHITVVGSYGRVCDLVPVGFQVPEVLSGRTNLVDEALSAQISTPTTEPLRTAT